MPFSAGAVVAEDIVGSVVIDDATSGTDEVVKNVAAKGAEAYRSCNRLRPNDITGFVAYIGI